MYPSLAYALEMFSSTMGMPASSWTSDGSPSAEQPARQSQSCPELVPLVIAASEGMWHCKQLGDAVQHVQYSRQEMQSTEEQQLTA